MECTLASYLATPEDKLLMEAKRPVSHLAAAGLAGVMNLVYIARIDEHPALDSACYARVRVCRAVHHAPHALACRRRRLHRDHCKPGLRAKMTYRLLSVFLCIVVWVCSACGPETTSFRTTDKTADANRPGPPAATYDVRMADQPIANVHVWSNGGYVSVSEEPMTHIGFEIHNASPLPFVFDGDVLALTVFDSAGTELPLTRITSVEPLGLAQRPIRPGATVILGAYFEVLVRPRAVATMQVRWALRAGDQRYLQLTRFARDDDSPVVAPHSIEAHHAKS